MSSPIHRHHAIHHHHIEMTKDEPESKVIPLHDPDAPEDTVEVSDRDPKADPQPTLLDTLMNSPITVGSFTDQVQLPLNHSKEKVYNNDQMISMNDVKLYEGMEDQGKNLGNIEAALQNYITDYQTLVNTQNSQISGTNGTINAYNGQITSADSSALATLNAGTALYNAGKINLSTYETEYVFPYNSYATGNAAGTGTGGRNATIQGTINNYKGSLNTLNNVDVPANNATTNTLNSVGNNYPNVPPIASQSTVAAQKTALLPVMPVPPPAAGSAPTLVDSRTTLTTIPPIPPPPTTFAFMQTYWTPIFNAATGGFSLGVSKSRINNVTSEEDYRRTYLRGQDPKKVDIPDANVEKHPHMANDSTASSLDAGGGVSTAVLGSGKGSPLIQSTFSDSIYGATTNIFQLNTVRHHHRLRNKLKHYGALALNTAGLQSLNAALRALKLGNLTPHQLIQAFGVSLGISTATSIVGLVNSGATGKAVHSYVEEELKGKASQETINRTSRILTAELNIALLQSAGTSASIALGAPGLPTQLTANVKGLPGNVAATPLSHEQVLNDSAKKHFLTSTLTGTLSSDDKISREKAHRIVTTAIDSAINSGSITNSDSLRSSLIQSFLAQGLTKEEATRLGDQAVAIVQRESTGTRILHEPLLNRNSDVNLLIPLLQHDADIRGKKARDLATKAIEQVLENQSITNNTEFELALQQQLEKKGISGPVAGRIANSLVNGVAASAPGTLSSRCPRTRYNARHSPPQGRSGTPQHGPFGRPVRSRKCSQTWPSHRRNFDWSSRQHAIAAGFAQYECGNPAERKWQ